MSLAAIVLIRIFEPLPKDSFHFEFDNSNPIYTDYQGTHSHTFTTSTVAAHSHSITVDLAGGVETTPPNIAVKVYGLLRF